MAKQVDTTYGNALFELALEQNQIDLIFHDAKEVVNILLENADFVKLLAHPRVSKEEKISLVEKAFKGNISDDITGLIVMIVKKDHSSQVVEVFNAFIKMVKNYKNIGEATVTSAVDLSEDKKKAILSKLIETTKYSSLEISYNVDKSIIGGLIIRIEDRVVDSSIKTKLNTLSKSLKMA